VEWAGCASGIIASNKQPTQTRLRPALADKVRLITLRDAAAALTKTDFLFFVRLAW